MMGEFSTCAVLEAGQASRALSDNGAHDVVCVLPGTPVWQDIAIPGYSLLHIPDGDLWGEVFTYDGLSVSTEDGSALFTYSVNGFLVRFSADAVGDLSTFTIGSGPAGPLMDLCRARSVTNALSNGWTDAPGGFTAVTEEIGSDTRIAYHRMELVPGMLSVCTDGSESWMESERSDFGITGFRMNVSADGTRAVLWIDTDRCSFGFPVGGGSR